MKVKRTQTGNSGKRRGFTLIELMIGGTIMLVVIIAALSVYSSSNKVSVDQSQYTDLQNEVRSAMYMIIRDVRMAGASIPEEYNMYDMEGVDNEDQGEEVRPDRLTIMGNISVPMDLRIQDYQGSSVTLSVYDYSFEQYSYPDDFYANKVALVLPNPSSGCLAGEVRSITHVTHSSGGTNEAFNFSPGLAPGIDPPGGLSGTCSSSNDYDGGSILFVDVITYWLDVTGDYPGLTAGVNGYIGGGVSGVLYMTKNGVHYPLAQNIENFQVQYNGDLNDDGALDGFQDWSTAWTAAEISRIRQARLMILGRTPSPFVSVSGKPPADIHLYRRPLMANSPAATTDDKHRRFLIESAANIRNMSLSLYNEGVR